jgi:hypothetical protein
MVDERYEQATGLDAAEGVLSGKGKEAQRRRMGRPAMRDEARTRRGT